MMTKDSIKTVGKLTSLLLAVLSLTAANKAAAGNCGQGMASLRPNVSTKGGQVNMHVLQGLVDRASQIATNPRTRAYNRGHVVITDGCRSPAQNSRTRGSARNSAHLRGHALDLRAHNGSPQAYAAAIQSAGLAQGGFYNTCRPHVHIDTEHRGFSNECGGKGKFKRRGGNGNRSYSPARSGNIFSQIFGVGY